MKANHRRLVSVMILLSCSILSGYAQDPEYEAWLKKEQQKLQEYKQQFGGKFESAFLELTK